LPFQPIQGPWSLIQLRNHISQRVGLLGRVVSPSQGLCLNTGQHKHRINIHDLSGIRTHDPSVRASEDMPVTGRGTRMLTDNSLLLYSEGAQFESELGRELSWFRFFAVSSGLSKQMFGHVPRLGNAHVLQILSISSLLLSCDVWLLTASSNIPPPLPPTISASQETHKNTQRPVG
jgi:hypothetical protein